MWLTITALAGCGDEPTGPRDTSQGGSSDTGAVSLALAAWPVFTQITVGGQHSCALMGDGKAYCWGYNSWGQLGTGFASIQERRPRPVAGGLRFAQISAGTDHTCGITTENRAYCWGANYGTLGDGTYTGRSSPVAVAGTRRFRQIRAGVHHTCAVNTSDVAFCWGVNFYGQLGDGTRTDRLVPVRVLGGLTFRRVIAGAEYTCGVTTGSRGYCWGNNADGQLGDGTITLRLKPVPVAGGLSFSQVIAGSSHSCGVTTTGRGYCWGENYSGQLGIGTVGSPKRSPVRVAGTRTYRQVIPGYKHTCGVTTSNVALCWGENYSGQNGTGNTSFSSSPVMVAGGLAWSGVSTGVQETESTDPFENPRALHSCGLTTGNRVYCWGANGYGQIGDGTDSRRLSPTPVVSPS